MTDNSSPHIFVVGERVKMWQGDRLSKPVVTAVNGDEVVVSMFGNDNTFKRRASDGKYVAAGQESSSYPNFITPIPAPKKWTWRDVRDSILGAIWGASNL